MSAADLSQALVPEPVQGESSLVVAPLVTVVVATYRTPAALLRETLASALAQEWPALEVLVCDDSPDARLSDFVAALADARLHYMHNSPALGVARNHWAALARARGEFIAVLNHDDRWLPGFLPQLAAVLQADPSASLAFCDHWVIDGSGQRLIDATDSNTRAWQRDGLRPGLQLDTPKLLVNQSMPIAMGTLFRRSALPAEMPAGAGPAYDLWLGYLLTRNGAPVWYLPERLSEWRSHEGNLTSGMGDAWLHGAAQCWEAMALDPHLQLMQAVARQRAASARWACAMRGWADGAPSTARAQALRSMQWRLSWRGLAAWCASWLPGRWAPPRWRRTVTAAVRAA